VQSQWPLGVEELIARIGNDWVGIGEDGQKWAATMVLEHFADAGLDLSPDLQRLEAFLQKMHPAGNLLIETLTGSQNKLRLSHRLALIDFCGVTGYFVLGEQWHISTFV
jgi:hypothetical protein